MASANSMYEVVISSDSVGPRTQLPGQLFQRVGANVTTSVVSGKGAEWDKNLVNAGFGMAGGAVAGKLLGNVGEGMARNVGEGALGGALGSLGGDTANNVIHGEKFDASQMLIGAAGGAAGGGAGGGLKHLAMDNFAPPAPEVTTPGSTPGDTADGATQPEVGRDHYSDAADLALGKPAGIFFGEDANDAKDADADELPPPTRAEMRAENERNAATAGEHAGNTTLQGDFG
ncbi:hypothetical protein N566_18225 [Streptomycetaceae bacterium MP113-05]|nr:hypothetical protein N566_18225 [Streptomycetaceae bacterium MP113-05]